MDLQPLMIANPMEQVMFGKQENRQNNEDTFISQWKRLHRPAKIASQGNEGIFIPIAASGKVDSHLAPCPVLHRWYRSVS